MSLEPQLQSVDRNLQAIRAIEGAWSLPALPDEVKVDLAGNTAMSPQALNSLLTGLDDDLYQVERAEPLPTRTDLGVEPPVNPDYAYEPPVSTRTQTGLLLAGVTDVPTPQVYSTSAHVKLKQRLADEGYLNLSPEDIASDRWLPEYSYAASQMNWDDMTREFQGNKPGSFSVESIMGFVDEWLSPRGLYRAAVELDLWWDTEAIAAEIDDWDADLQAWREDPWNPRKVVDLVTGPLDDILFPAINIALLFTGIGEVMAVSRGALGGVKGIQALQGLYRGGKGAGFAARLAGRGLADINRFSEAGWLAQKLPQKAGQVMQAWRSRGAVIAAKKVNQQAMRMGFLSNLEQLIDADRGGQSIDHFTGGRAGEAVYEAFSNPMLDWGVDLLFTPTNIWNPGTFSKPLKAGREAVQRGFLKAADNENLLLAWDAPVQSFLEELDTTSEYGQSILQSLKAKDGADAVKKYRQMTGDVGMKQALANVFFDGQEEVMGAALGYSTTMAALDHWARRMSDAAVGDPLHRLTSASRRAFHHMRNQGISRMRQLDPANVEDVVHHFAKYGTDPKEFVRTGQRNARRYQQTYRQVQDQFLETAEEAAARGTAIPDGHTRFLGQRNPDTGQIEWKASRDFAPVEEDPFYLDLRTSELQEYYGEGLADVLAGERNLDDVFSHRYRRRQADGSLRHYRLSEAGKVRLYSEDGLEKLRGLVDHHNELRGEFVASLFEDLTPEAVSQYIYEILPREGRWGDFVTAEAHIAKAAELGHLDNVRFVSPMSEANRKLSAMPWTPGEETWVNEMFGMILELPDDEQLYGKLMQSVFSPLARDVDPQMGRFAAAAADTVTKQEALAFGATARRTLEMVRGLRKIRALPNADEVVRITRQYVDAGGDVTTKTGLREVLAEAIGSSVSEDRLADLAALARTAEEAGVSLDDVERVLMNKLADINADARWAERFNVPTQMQETVDDLVSEVGEKVRELERQSYFMASEVEGAPDWLVSELNGRGYKLVYGVEFADPADLDGILPAFADAKRSHVRRKTLGNFFDRQDPKAVSALKARKVREGLHARLANLEDAGEGARQLNLGKYPDPENADMKSVMNDLWQILDEVQEEARNKLDSLPNQGFVEKIGTRASLARIPFSLDRLASDLRFKDFIARVMGKGYSKKQAVAIYHALQSSQALGFKTHGLYAIESSLRSRPQLLNGLRYLGTTAEGDKFRKGRALMGSLAGGYAANYASSEMGMEPGSGGQLAATAGGFLLGGALGAKGGLPGARALADSLETSAAVARFSYIADELANIRDLVRFSLSPIFDASRYSEAIILGQIGDMPQGLRNLKVNQSPSSFRRMVAREHRNAGVSAERAKDLAAKEFGRYQDEFAAAARGYRDFDWEVIDGVGRRFSSVGILGFSPVDWMSSTFAHLRRNGVDARKAYDTVRDIYTYGTTGRSAAELSMNFVFFPFSFTKKTVGHFAKFFSEDIGRLVVLQDALASYQLLDEEFDLSQEWRDRLPILQKAHRLNLLAYGVGLGQFGGINAPFMEAIPGWDEAKASVVNAFMPQTVPMATAEDGDQAWDTLRGLMPVVNDVNTMMTMLVDQGRVIASESHLTARAEQRHAWDEWRQFQQEVETALEPSGLTWDQAVRRPELNEFIKAERTRISEKYPQWKWGMGDGIAHGQAIEMELNERIQYPKENADLLLGEFQGLVDQVEQAAGRTFTGSPESIPPQGFDLFRRLAIEYAEQDPAFLRLYNRFYRRTFGDITEDVA